MTKPKKRRPVFFNLARIQMPMGALTSSITRRVTASPDFSAFVPISSACRVHSFARLTRLLTLAPEKWTSAQARSRRTPLAGDPASTSSSVSGPSSTIQGDDACGG